MSRRGMGLVVAVMATAVMPVFARQAPPAAVRTMRPKFDGVARLSEWTLDGSGTWTIAGNRLVLSKAGTPAGAIRRPAALAILKSEPFSNVTVSAALRCMAALDVPTRDMEIVFDYQSPSRFYYVHLAGILNDVHNGIFLVNDQDRKRIDPGTTPAQLKDQAWHAVRVERDGSAGTIRVFVDGSKAPVMQATDKTLASGQIGVGSFDDTGEIRNVVVTGR